MTDTSLTNDTYSFVIEKLLYDTITATDDLTYNAPINWGESDVGFITDTFILTFEKSLTDSAVTSDSGTINIQNYIVAGYTAEDYVGTNTNFWGLTNGFY